MATVTDAKSKTDNYSITDLPKLLIGADELVPTLSGLQKYINLDNAASTPTFQPIADAVLSFLRWYSNVHRGTGFKSQLSSWVFEQSRETVTEFIGANLDNQVVIFTKNSTEAINKLANRMPFARNDIILTTMMEHHSNELPWRRAGRVEHIGLNDDGTISKDNYLHLLSRFGKSVRLVAITGASNVTGFINDLDFFASKAHEAGAKILVDAAQLVPHRPVSMKSDDPVHGLDFLVFSGHKMYAPFGIGVLVGDKETFEQGDPEEVGGGVVDIVTLEEAYWTDLPEKEEAGTPDIIGVVALAKAIKLFQAIGWDEIIRHESELTTYALDRLKQIPNVTLYGCMDAEQASSRLGVISMNIEGVPHALAAAILNYEGAIGVRSGCFCAHTYVKCLLKVSDEDSHTMEQQILSRDRSHLPGTIRMSFGLYNTKDEIDRLTEVIGLIASGKYVGDYVLNKEKGEYHPRGFEVNMQDYFRL